MQQTAAHSEANAPDAFTPRQNDVLQTALNMLVEGGDRALTTGAIARAANCSKESLYKWFGDRDGMLAAVIFYQASKVRVLAPGEAPGSRSEFRDHLVRFADDLMRVLSGDVSLALNRLAIGQAGNQDAHLGQLVRERGRQAIGSGRSSAGDRAAARLSGFRRSRGRFPDALWPDRARSACAAVAWRAACWPAARFRRAGGSGHRQVFPALRSRQQRSMRQHF